MGTGPKSGVETCLEAGGRGPALVNRRPVHPGASDRLTVDWLADQSTREHTHETHLLTGPMPHSERNVSGWRPLQPRHAQYNGECKGTGIRAQADCPEDGDRSRGLSVGRGGCREQEMHIGMHVAGGRQMRGGAGTFPYLSPT